MPDNVFKGSPFGGRVPMSGAPGGPVPVINGGPARPPMGQVPAAQGFMPAAPAMPPVPGAARNPAPAAPKAPAARPQAPGTIPAGSKADCPVCRPFGRR